MNKLAEKYFSIGEFASLFKLSKQTLFYYERNNILKPSYIDENGYRYYSLEQYFIFDIIINMRKLGIPLKEIADYIQNRDVNALQLFYKRKQTEYQVQIDIMQRNIANLQTKINHLEKIKNVTTDKITLEEQAEEYYIATPFSVPKISLKEKIKLVAKHNYPFASSELLNEYLMGYILPKDALQQGNFLAMSNLYTRISHPDEYTDVQIKKVGLYASIYTPNGFHTQYECSFKKLLAFIERNALTIIGDVYIEQLRNYWSTADYTKYIVKIMIPVDYL